MKASFNKRSMVQTTISYEIMHQRPILLDPKKQTFYMEILTAVDARKQQQNQISNIYSNSILMKPFLNINMF